MDFKALLLQIIHTADALQRGTQCLSKHHSRSSREELDIPDVPPLFLNIPSSTHLVPELVDAGAPTDVAKALSEKFKAAAERLADYQSNTVYTDALRKLRSHPSTNSAFISVFQEAHRQTYQRTVSKWKEDIRNSVKERAALALKAAKQERNSKVFDQKYVPFLEKCFSKNRRPSRADKDLLAEKTGLSFRQIHVWFQNRRSRTKATFGPSDSQSEELTPCSRASSITLVEDDPLSSHVAPSYAYPVMYPPEIEEDPFPCRFGDFSSFAKPCWPHPPSIKQRLASEQPDVSVLISAFEKLQLSNVSDSKTKRKGRSTSSVSKFASNSCCEMIRPAVVRPLRAPLSSLVQVGTAYSSGTSSQESDLAKQNESTNKNAEHPKAKARRPRHRRAVEQGQNEGDQQSLSPTEPVNEQRSVASTVPSKTKRARKKAVRSKPAARKGCKTLAEPVVAVDREPEEPPSCHPSPTTSIESLPSLSCSTASSSESSSTYSVSPPSSFTTLSNDGLLSSPLDEYQSSGSSLILPPSLTFDDYPPPPATFTSDGFSFDLPKGPLDYSFGFDLPGYPSCSDSFDSLVQELGLSSDFMFPSSFEVPCLAS